MHPQPASLLDYLPQKTLILVDDLSVVESMVAEVEEQALKVRQGSIAEGKLSADFPLPYITWTELLDAFNDRAALELGYSSASEFPSPSRRGDRGEGEDLAACFGHDERFAGRLKPFIDHVSALASRNEAVIVVSRQSERLQDLWQESGEQREENSPSFIEASLSEGFVLRDQSLISTHLITDSAIFGWERPQPRPRLRQAAETPETVYADLQPGDYVVHIDHGVGRFVGLVQRQLDSHLREFLAVEYENGGQLYVPVHQADRLTRYVGAEGAEPALDRLGGQEWREKKSRVKEAVLEVA